MNVLNDWPLVAGFFRPHFSDVAAAQWRLVEEIQRAAERLRELPAQVLRERASRLRAADPTGRLADRSRLLESASLLQAAAYQSLSVSLYDVQLLAGLALAEGAVAQMQTGEGKTLAGALPAFLKFLHGWRVHVATPNAYLASRDFETLSPLFQALGMSSALLPERAGLETKRRAYQADVVYGTGYEFGFDFLREHLQLLEGRPRGLGQGVRKSLRGETSAILPLVVDRRRTFVLIDEIDSVLIDEGCLPLILAGERGTNQADAAAHLAARAQALSLVAEKDFVIDSAQKAVMLTPSGAQRAQAEFDNAAKRPALLRPWTTYIEQALRAQWLLERDVDYVVDDQRIQLVDQHTGRIFAERSLNDGLHRAVEVKEGLPQTGENAATARITRQRYFRTYGGLSGMTGTAETVAREFTTLYGLRVVNIPLRTPSQRQVWPTLYFPDVESKWQAIVREIATVHQTGRPVLIGTRTIENSRHLADRLQRTGILFRLLNGRQNEAEANVIARSGECRAVTVATNMAGRGTDIKLAAGVGELGGLHVIGVGRQDSRRIDDQLSGRSARQGDPGSCRFFVSADDELIGHHLPRVANQLRTAPVGGTSSRELDERIEALQRALDRRGFQERRRQLAYDRWLDEINEKLALG